MSNQQLSRSNLKDQQPELKNTSLWLESPEAPHASRSAYLAETDVVVVGAGLTGLHTALALKEAGRSVTVIEAKAPGSGTSGHTSAHVSSIPDPGYATIAGKHGDQVAKLVGEVLRNAVDEMERRGPDCDWKRVPVYLFAASEQDVSKIDDERGALIATGFRVAALDSAPLPTRTLSALRIEDQAQFHPVKYIAALKRELEVQGIPIICGVMAESVEENSQGVTLTTSENSLSAKHVVMATHYPWSLITEAEAIPYRSYLVAMETEEPLEPGLFWDTADPYHYIRSVEIDGETLALVGGSDHRTGFFHDDDLRAYAELEAYARNQIRATRVRYQWSAQFYEPFDDIPFIGKAPGKEKLWIATGYSGNGLAFAVAAGKLLAQAIGGVEHPLMKAMRPGRKPSLTSSPTLFAEGARTGYRYAKDRLLRKGEEALQRLGSGEAGVFKIDGKLVAAHRDEHGELSRCSAICSHKGGIVQWNPLEKSWDCPIHGGRFSCRGKWMEGPPTKDLELKSEAETERNSAAHASTSS